MDKRTYERWERESKGLILARTEEEQKELLADLAQQRAEMEKRQREAGLIK